MLDFFIKGGPLMYPLLLCSIIGFAIIVCKLIKYRSILGAIERPIAELKKSTPPLLQPLFTEVAEGATERELVITGTRQLRQVETGLSWLALIATIAPLLGLSGTVLGMIKAFFTIEQSKSVSPELLAGGIWVALITTVTGLFVAILVHIGHHYLEKQADEIAFIMKEIMTDLASERSNGT